MKRILSILTILFFSNIVVAQTTAIPDPNFEQALIDLGLDSGPINGVVLTANINTVTSLDVHLKFIIDLTGIEDFTSLTELNCGTNQITDLDLSQNTALTKLNCNNCTYLTSLNLSQNTALTYLECRENNNLILDLTQNTALTYLNCFGCNLTNLDLSQNTALNTLDCTSNHLTNIDLTQNTALTYLDCFWNQLTSLDVTQNILLTELSCFKNPINSLDLSQNTNLTKLHCSNNQLTSLDVTQNTALTGLSCYSNQLTGLDLTQNIALISLLCYNNPLYCLNVKNGNNTNFITMYADNNANLSCIEVDNVAWSTASSNWRIDAGASFSTNCGNPCGVGVNENNLSNISIYPTPTTSSINIDLEETKSNINLRLTNGIGQVILTKNYKSTNHINFDLDPPKGVYFLQLESDGQLTTRKIIIE